MTGEPADRIKISFVAGRDIFDEATRILAGFALTKIE